MGLFRRSKKKKKTKGDDASLLTDTQDTQGPVRVSVTGIRKLQSPEERARKARASAREEELAALDNKSSTTVQHPKSNWLTRTKFFQDMCQSAFELIDADESGEVDEKELYSGLLLIHLKLGTYAGPAACRPLSRERCHAVFLKFDKDNSGYLDRQEFGNVMGVLFGNVLSRVVLQYCLTLLIVPFLAKMVVDGIVGAVEGMWYILSTLDEHSSVAHQIELLVELVRDGICQFYRAIMPAIFQKVGDGFVGLVGKVPESVWMSLPLTLTSAILGLLIVPRSIMMMDDFFQHLADKKSKQV